MDRFFVGAHPVGDGRAHALKTIAHRVGSYKNKNIQMTDTNVGNSNFIGPNQ